MNTLGEGTWAFESVFYLKAHRPCDGHPMTGLLGALASVPSRLGRLCSSDIMAYVVMIGDY